MIVPLLLIAGLVALVAGALLLRRVGSGYRVGRLLAAAPQMTLEEVISLASSGQRRYVRTHGRIASDEEFPDDQHRPLVFRRRRLQRGDGRGRWVDIDEERLAVPFWLEDHGSVVMIDADSLGDGLVVTPREATGTVGDLPPDVSIDSQPLGPATPIKLRIDQVSAVEHATAVGVPGLSPDGQVLLSAGLGRPLILTTLDPGSAMRILATGRRDSMMVAAGLLVAGPACLALALGAYLLRL